jgi:hypothetical protein
MYKKPNKNAIELSPEQIIALIGKSYKEFVYNVETLFPGSGKDFCRLLVNSRDKLYYDFEIAKRSSKKMRLITAPSEILKILQSGLSNFAETQFVNHPESHGFVKGRCPRTAAESLKRVKNKNEKQVTNIDIQGAFPSITGAVVRSMLRHDTDVHLTPWQVNVLGKIATRQNDVLATGAPSSPILFNWRMTRFDHEVEAAAKKRGWHVVRYADDISVSHYQTQKREAIELIKRMLKPLGLRIERRKLKTFSHGYTLALGLVITDDSIQIVRAARRTMRGLVNRFAGKYGETTNHYTHEDAGRILRQMPKKFARMKHSTSAVLAGYCAYIIGIDRPYNKSHEQFYL